MDSAIGAVEIPRKDLSLAVAATAVAASVSVVDWLAVAEKAVEVFAAAFFADLTGRLRLGTRIRLASNRMLNWALKGVLN
jgi:hypothetical protein